MTAQPNASHLTDMQSSAILRGIRDAVVVTGLDGAPVYVNLAARSLYELTASDLDNGDLDNGASAYLHERMVHAPSTTTLSGTPIVDDDHPLVRSMRGEAFGNVELLVKSAGREPRLHVFTSDRIETDTSLNVLVIRDETERWRAEAHGRAAFEANPAPTVVARLEDTEILKSSLGMGTLTGLEPSRLIGRPLLDFQLIHHEEESKGVYEQLQRGEPVEGMRTLMLTAEGREITVELTARSIEIGGQTCGIFAFTDITDIERIRREHQSTKNVLQTTLAKHAHEKATHEHLTVTDALTGIPSRRGLATKLSEEFLRAHRYGNAYSVLLLDVDRFKSINDHFGLEAGDDLLRAMAKLLTDECRSVDVAGRWSGAEFMVILPEITTPGAKRVASRVRERVARETLAGISDITVSIGLASSQQGDTPDSLVQRTVQALVAAKKLGRNRVEVAPADAAGE